jgi:uncharacterized membrane protein (UPF0127 family)
VSAHKLRKPIVVDAIIILVVAIAFGVFWLVKNSGPSLHAGKYSYHLIVAKTTAQQTKGLGDRNSLPTNEGMLFLYPNSGERCFWMKDMRFPLDMIWTDSHKKVVALEQNVSPQTYPETFCSKTPAQYVIELNAGQVSLAGIRAGQTLSF